LILALTVMGVPQVDEDPMQEDLAKNYHSEDTIYKNLEVVDSTCQPFGVGGVKLGAENWGMVDMSKPLAEERMNHPSKQGQ